MLIGAVVSEKQFTQVWLKKIIVAEVPKQLQIAIISSHCLLVSQTACEQYSGSGAPSLASAVWHGCHHVRKKNYLTITDVCSIGPNWAILLSSICDVFVWQTYAADEIRIILPGSPRSRLLSQAQSKIGGGIDVIAPPPMSLGLRAVPNLV